MNLSQVTRRCRVFSSSAPLVLVFSLAYCIPPHPVLQRGSPCSPEKRDRTGGASGLVWQFACWLQSLQYASAVGLWAAPGQQCWVCPYRTRFADRKRDTEPVGWGRGPPSVCSHRLPSEVRPGACFLTRQSLGTIPPSETRRSRGARPRRLPRPPCGLSVCFNKS